MAASKVLSRLLGDVNYFTLNGFDLVEFSSLCDNCVCAVCCNRFVSIYDATDALRAARGQRVTPLVIGHNPPVITPPP